MTPVQDGTIWEGQTNLASGAGTQLFAGHTNAAEARRALIQFDVAGSIPAGSSIVSARASITINRFPSGGGSPATFSLHRVLEAWGTGSSIAGGQGGRGGQAVSGDVTWTHRELGSTRWATDGGAFVSEASGQTTSGAWVSNDALVADVQGWLTDPGANHGWIIIGAESGNGTARRFSSSEDTSPPTLTIVFVSGG